MSFFDRVFEREFKTVITNLKRSTSPTFNVADLGLEPTLESTIVKEYLKVKDIPETSIFKDLNGEIVARVSEDSFDSVDFSYMLENNTLRAPKGYVTVVSKRLIRVLNKSAIDKSIIYVGIGHIGSVRLQILYVSEELAYPLPTYAVTIATKRVSNHYGGYELLLTNAHKVNIVIQNRTRLKNTEAKNVYYVSPDLEETKNQINRFRSFLVNSGRSFYPDLFKVNVDVNGLSTDYNLVESELAPTEDVDLFIEFSIAQNKRDKGGVYD